LKKSVFFIIVFLLLSHNVFAKDYVIGGGDTLQISVWGSPELSVGVMVRPDGKISIPALGEVKATGLTPMELKTILEKKMKKLVKTPVVTVIATGMTNYRIFVIGRGAPAGVTQLSRETSLLEFLAQLGSLEEADLESAYLVRNKKQIKSDFTGLFEKGDFKQDIVLEPNDIIFIPDSFEKRITIVGEVEKPDTILYRKGLTVLDVILSAGGFTEFAKKNDVLVMRKSSDGKREKITVKVKDLMKGKIDRNLEIVPGDFIVVKETLF
jgi:polysaccharide export outer membrane protein